MDDFRPPSSAKRRKSIKNTLRGIRKPRLTIDDLFASPEAAQCQTFLSHNRKKKDERNLEQRLDVELKMRDGTAKLMAASNNPTMALQAAKSMLASNERIGAYVNRMRSQNSKDNADGEARVAVSDIRIPLIWKDSAHFKNRGDYRKFAVFCLLRIGCEIYDTSLCTDVDPTVTDITFEDCVVFSNAGPDFEMRIEVYCNLSSSDSRASYKRLPLGDSIGKTVGRKLAASLKDDLDADNMGPKYEMIAHAILRLDDVNDAIKTHDFLLESADRPFHHVPLFGHFCCRLAAQPDFLTEEFHFDQIVVSVNTCSKTLGQCLWAVLKGTNLTFYSDSAQSELHLTFPINPHTILEKSANANSLTVATPTSLESESYTLHFPDPEGSLVCWDHLQRRISQSVMWKSAAQTMDIPSPAPSRVLPSGRRKFSLYEETRLKDSPARPNTKITPENSISQSCFPTTSCISGRETSV